MKTRALAAVWLLLFVALPAGVVATEIDGVETLAAEGENALVVSRNLFVTVEPQSGDDPLPTHDGNEPAQRPTLFGRLLNFVARPSAEDQVLDGLESSAVHRIREDETLAQPTVADRIVADLSPQAQSNGETLFNGLGGVPTPLSARYLTAPGDQQTGFVLGPTWVRPSLGAGVTYRSQSGGGTNYDDVYATVIPSIDVALGSPGSGAFLNVRYQGILSLGETGDGQGVYDQSLQVGGALHMAKLNLGTSLQATQLSGADQDFGGTDVNRLLLSFSLTGSYRYSERTAVDLTLSVPIREYEEGSSSQGVNGQTFLNWNYSPLTTFGVGLGLGALAVEGQTQFYEQALLRLGYTPSPKLSFEGTLGCEFRDAGQEEEITPIFRLGAVWQSLSGTSVALSGERSIFNSAAESRTNYVTTSVSLTVNQRLGRYLQATGSVGYNDNEYTSTGTGGSGDRSDQYLMFQAGLAIQLRAQWRAVLSASYGQLVYSGATANDGFTVQRASAVDALANGTLHLYQSNLQLTYDF